MRKPPTLDEDVAAKLKAGSRRAGRSFRDVDKEALRRGLASRRVGRRKPLTLQVCDLGVLKPELSLDNIWKLVEQVEGPLHL